MALVLVGGHVAVLQTVAWVGMVSARVTSEGFSGALESTFDGQHPCRLCLAAKHLRDNETPDKPQSPPNKMVKKADLHRPEILIWMTPPSDGVMVMIREPVRVVAPLLPSPEPPPPKRA